MIEQNNVLALKKLAAKIIGGDTFADDIAGNTIADVLDVITANFESNTPLILGTLTLNSVLGSTAGKTVVTVTPELGVNNSYRYKTDLSSIVLPERNEDLSSWTSWDGVSEIAAENGHKICVCEVDANNLALKGGTATVVAI